MTTNETTQPPDGMTEEHLTYLDELRESSIVNMFAAGPYLQAEFDLDRATARAYLIHWMNTFSARHAGHE